MDPGVIDFGFHAAGVLLMEWWFIVQKFSLLISQERANVIGAPRLQEVFLKDQDIGFLIEFLFCAI